MTGYTEKIREAAKRLLTEKKVDCFIGFRKGSVPMVNYPVIVSDPAKADELIWDANCAMNLANYVIGRKDKVGILATGCVARNLVTLVQENQIKREQLYIIGLPCSGMIDKSQVIDKYGDVEIVSVIDKGDTFAVEAGDKTDVLKKADFLSRNCKICAHHNPIEYDEIIGDKVADPETYIKPEDVKKSESMSDAERWEFFEKTFSPCIRCYACRNACPMCYCPTCFVDESRPQWVGKSSDETDTLTFHFLRALHLAGRCTDCGACERACPIDIPVRYLTSRLNADAKEIYGFESGLDPKMRPLLDHYKLDDLNDFFK